MDSLTFGATKVVRNLMKPASQKARGGGRGERGEGEGGGERARGRT
jgi:hypothetical protein